MTAAAQELITGVTIHKAGGYQVAFKGRALMYFKAEMLPLAIRMRREAEEIVADDPAVDLDVMVGVLRMKYSELKLQFAEGEAVPAEIHTPAAGSNGGHDHVQDEVEVEDQRMPEDHLDLPEPQESDVPPALAQSGQAIPQPPTYLDLLRAALDADIAYAETRLTLDLAQERHDAAKAVAMEAWNVFFREIGFWKGDPRQSALSLTKGWGTRDGA